MFAPALLPERTIIIVKLVFDPSTVNEVYETSFIPAYEAISALEINFMFKVIRDPKNPGRITLLEGWNMGFEEYWKWAPEQEYFKKYIMPAQPLLIEPREMHVFNEVEGLQHFVQ